MIKYFSIFIAFLFLTGFSFRNRNELTSKIFPEVLTNVYVTFNAGYMKFLPIEDEYNLKAAFVYRFIEYIEWGNFSNNENFHIAILNESGITAPLQAIAKTKTVGNKTMIVKVYNSMNEIGLCQILFIPQNSPVSIKSIVSKFGSKPTLIITEHEDYGKYGSHINFVSLGNKIKFEVNLKAIKKSGINISSELLKLAIIVG